MRGVWTESGSVMFGKRAEQEQIAALRAEVQSLQARLSADVSTLDPGDDPMSRSPSRNRD